MKTLIKFFTQLQKTTQRWKISPWVLLGSFSFVIAIIVGHVSSQSPQKQHVLSAQIFPSPTPTQMPTSVLTPSIVPTEKTFLPTDFPSTTPAPTVLITQTAQSQSQNNISAITPTSAQQIAKSTVHLEMNEPDGATSMDISFHEGNNPCSLLNDAKNDGKIKSVTIVHYDAPLNSDYVKEINGYQNNWTFNLNGQTEPKGCSNYALQAGDTVQWKYN